MSRALAARLSLVALVCSLPQRADAQAKTALSWVREQGAENCIGATELGRRVERLVGPVLVSAPEGQISIEGRIKRSGTGFEAAIAVSDAIGHLLGRRNVRSDKPDCRALDDQIAFVIAVAIDPNAALAELPGEFSEDTKPEAELLLELQANPPHPVPVATPAPAQSAHKVVAATPPRGIAWHAGGSLGGALALGAMPNPSAGLTGALSLWTDAWSHHLRATYWIPQLHALGSAASVYFRLSQVDLTTCPELWAAGGFHLAACAGVAVARLALEPQGFVGTSHARWLGGPLLSARLARNIAGPLSLVLSAGAQGLWPLHRIDYELSGNAQLVWQPPVVAGRADLSVELRF